MTRERKIYVILIIGYFASMFMFWFGNDAAIDGRRGISLLVENPAVLVGVALMVLGALKRSGVGFVLAGAALAFAGEIFEFLRWYTPAVGFDIGYSFQTAFAGFYVSAILLAALGAAAVAAAIRKKES